MSIINTIENTTFAVESFVGAEVNKISSNLDSAVGSFAGQLSTTMEAKFGQLKTLIDSSKSDIDNDLIHLGQTLAGIAQTGETAIEGVFQDAVKNVKKLSDDIGTAGINAVNSVQNAASYLSSGVRNDITGAIASAQNTFDSIETTFKNKVSGHANDFITFVQSQIDGFVSTCTS